MRISMTLSGKFERLVDILLLFPFGKDKIVAIFNGHSFFLVQGEFFLFIVNKIVLKKRLSKHTSGVSNKKKIKKWVFMFVVFSIIFLIINKKNSPSIRKNSIDRGVPVKKNFN